MKKLNPCVTGSTKVWTVDGVKSFKDLADANEDVKVYCLDGDGNVKVSKMFHPRITGYNIELVNSDVAILSPANVKDIFNLYPELRDRFTIIYLDIPVSIRRERLNLRYQSKIGDDNEVRLANDERDFKDFTLWDIRFEDVKSIDDFINNLSPKSKGDKD